MKLELGAGARVQPGWTAIDIAPRHGSIRADVMALPFQSGSIEAISAIDVLEHISYRSTRKVLAEWWRVLQLGGELMIQVPDADQIMRWYANDDYRLKDTPPDLPPTTLAGAQWRLLGGHADGRYADDATWFYNAHFAFFSAQSLTKELQWHGFVVRSVVQNAHPNLIAHATKP